MWLGIQEIKVTNRMPIMMDPFTRRPISSTIRARPEIPSHRLAECMRLDWWQQADGRGGSQHRGRRCRGVCRGSELPRTPKVVAKQRCGRQT